MSKRAKKPAKKARVHKTLKAAAKAVKRRVAATAKDPYDPAGRKGKVRVDKSGIHVQREDAGLGELGFARPFKVQPGEQLIDAARRVLGGHQTRNVSEIKIGKRHRKEFGDLKGLAQSIDERGALLQPIVITEDNLLIAGERRLRAWPLTKFKGQPIPVHVVTVDSIVAGEWDENARRKDFNPEEAVAIKKEIERQLSKLAKARMQAGTKADPKTKGNAGDQAARAAGFGRRTIEKAEAIVEAAEREPEKYGELREKMNKTGKVDAPFKKLKVMQQTEALRKAPPPLPMNGPYKTVLIDFPVPAEGEKDQETIDATGRSFRGYPEMSVESCCAYARDKILPILDADCSAWLTFPNFHIVNGFAHQITSAFAGFKPVTMLTWEKDKLGRGQVLRDKTEHAILITRGKPVFNIFGKDPPTTWLRAPRRENSRKPDELYALIERVTPAPRYAEIFSRGGRSELWDCHGDEVGKFAPEDARAAEAALMAEARAGTTIENEALAAGAEMGMSADTVRAVNDYNTRLMSALEAVEQGDVVADADMRAELQKRKLIKGRKPKLTAEGEARLAQLRQKLTNGEPTPMRRTLPGRNAALIAWAEQNGHVVSMTNDDEDNIATCGCGWQHKARRVVGNDEHAVEARQAHIRVMDEMVTNHWHAVYAHEQDAGLANAVDAEAIEDQQPTAEEPAAVPSEGGVPGVASASLAGSSEDEDLDIRNYAGGKFARTAPTSEAAE